MSSERELIDTGTDKRYVRRNAQGQFKESDDQGRDPSAKADDEPGRQLRALRLEEARISSIRMPRTRTPSKRPLAVAINGCSISGMAEVTPGVFFA